MAKALFCRADFDLPTHYLSAYSAGLIEYAQKNGYEVVDLYNDDPTLPARLEPFENELEKKPDLFIGAGHGNATVFTGQELELLLKVGVNDDLTSGVKSYLWACQTGAQLGPQMINKTCPLYIGYQDDFTFLYHPNYETRPLQDPYAKAFFDAGLASGYALLAGATPQEIFDLTLERYDYWWDYWLKQNDPISDDILTWLNWNRSNFLVITPSEQYEAKSILELPAIAWPLAGVAGAGLLLFLLSKA